MKQYIIGRTILKIENLSTTGTGLKRITNVLHVKHNMQNKMYLDLPPAFRHFTNMKHSISNSTVKKISNQIRIYSPFN